MSKNAKGGPGRALVKHHNHLVTEAKKQGYGRTKRVLESVTDVKDVEVVIEEAEEAGRLFSAQNPEPNLLISLDLNSSNNGLTPSERKEQQKTEEALYKDSIQIPRRPPWHAEMSTEELDARERQSFLNWRRKLARVEENEKLVLTPFEKNIEIWRQLWRVLERSDLVVTVVDARNPLFYRCCDLEAYVQEIDIHKRTMLLVNKADLLPVHIRQKWAKYFCSQGILYLFWSAKAASAALEGKDHTSHSESLVNPEELHKLGVSAEDIKIYGQEELLSRLQKEAEAISAIRKASTETNKQGQPILNQSSNLDSAYSESDVLISNPKVLDSGARRVVVGFVGYPNVGKSSTINALVGQKKTGVTSTPGKTKHFQTLIISDRLMLCDCPGLVFPSFSSSRHEMVASGVLPIDRLTDHRGAIQVVADRVPRSIFENIYRISLPKPKPYELQDRPPAAFELLRTYSQSRGYVGTGGLPDETRAARQILKDYIDGKLPHFELPPEETCSGEGEETSSTSPTLQTEDCRMRAEGVLELHGDELGSSASSAEEEAGSDLDSQVHSTVNKEVETKGKLLSVMGSSSLEGVLHDLDSFDSANGIKAAPPGKGENRKKMHAPHKMHKKTQRTKDRSWRVGNDESDGMPAVKAVQKPVSYGASRVHY